MNTSLVRRFDRVQLRKQSFVSYFPRDPPRIVSFSELVAYTGVRLTKLIEVFLLIDSWPRIQTIAEEREGFLWSFSGLGITEGMDEPIVTNITSVADFVLKYRLIRIIGVGSFAKVMLAEHRLSSVLVAIKIISRRRTVEENLQDKLRREVRTMELLRHPHIIRLYEVVETPEDVLIVMEYANSGELFDYIIQNGRLPEGEARWFFQQIIAGVDYCHNNMVIHRDLKAENLLLDSRRHVKIADFGLSNTRRNGQFLSTSCGSTNYAAPEVLFGRPYEGPEVDVWSCGVVLYALLCGQLPFDDESVPALFAKIQSGSYVLPNHVPSGPRELITQMLVVDPVNRITITQIKQHPWFRDDLPLHLRLPASNGRIDEQILRKVVSLGIDRTQLLNALHNKHETRGTVTYYILLNKERHISNGYRGY